jgi:hypothetical protein
MTSTGFAFPHAHDSDTRIMHAVSTQGFTTFALRCVPSFLVICFVLLGTLAVAQEVDVPSGRGKGSVFAPSGWAELITPIQNRVDLKLYGFYIGEVEHHQRRLTSLFGRQSFFRSHPAISITRSLQAALTNSRMFREDLLAASRSTNFGSTGR